MRTDARKYLSFLELKSEICISPKYSQHWLVILEWVEKCKFVLRWVTLVNISEQVSWITLEKKCGQLTRPFITTEGRKNKNRKKLIMTQTLHSNEAPTKHQNDKWFMKEWRNTISDIFNMNNRLISQQDGNVSWRRESARKGLNTTSSAQFAALPLVKPVVWFARAVVNWRSRSVAKSA